MAQNKTTARAGDIHPRDADGRFADTPAPSATSKGAKAPTDKTAAKSKAGGKAAPSGKSGKAR